MAHFAKIGNGIVLEVHAVDNYNLDPNNEETSGVDFLTKLHNYADWKQTSYNGRIRYNYAGIGYGWDGTGFYSPQPYPSWTLDEAYQWQPPVPYPIDDKRYTWNETLGAWVEFTQI